MFRNKRHIKARNNEWVHVHRNNRQYTDMDIAKIVGVSIGALLLVLLVWELIKLTYPFLIAAGVIAAIVYFKNKS
ncbi:MAG: hypothetical protein NTY01_08200 [Verrucomicrobia bacterium]|nr:hypothetical protein [Verrucomicrobiota bacterium]